MKKISIVILLVTLFSCNTVIEFQDKPEITEVKGEFTPLFNIKTFVSVQNGNLFFWRDVNAGENYKLDILNFQGTVMHSIRYNNIDKKVLELNLNVSSYSPGFYDIVVTNDLGQKTKDPMVIMN
jgi:hypothetical protein